MAKNKIAPESKEDDQSIFGEVAVAVKPEHALVWQSNIPELKTMLTKVAKKYKGLKVTEENFESCDVIRKQCVTTRRMLEAEKKNTLDMYVKLPADIIKAQYDELLSLVDTVESNLKDQFAVFDKEKIDELTEIFTDYRNKVCDELGIPEESRSKIELKKSFFNKTAKEAVAREDIKAQAEALASEIAERKQSVELIKMECAADKRLNPEHYAKQLEYRPASAILFDIKSEKKRLADMDENGESPIVVGEPTGRIAEIIGKGAKPAPSRAQDTTMKELLVTLVYPAYAGEKINAFFAENPEIQVTINRKKGGKEK